MFPEEEIRFLVQQNLGLCINEFKPVHGGDINTNFKLLSGSGPACFLKFNQSPDHRSILGSEWESLDKLREHDIPSPRLFFIHHTASWSILVMECIEGKKVWTQGSTDSFAKTLAALHAITHSDFGWDSNNCIGSLRQENSWYPDLPSYYWNSRILPQLNLACSKGFLDLPKNYSGLYAVLESFPVEPPCLIHGDLWSGNYLLDSSGKAFLIDPCVSFGSREMDIAMMQLFGGFPSGVYDLYQDLMPLVPGWEGRLEVYQLYYLLVHLNIFGPSYLGQVLSILGKYN